MKNVKISSTKNQNKSIFKVATLTLLFTVISNFQALAADQGSSVETLLQNPVIKYSIIAIGFILVITVAITTSFKGNVNKPTKKPKAINPQNFKHKIASHTARRGAPTR